MNGLDKVIGFFSPKAGVMREAYRQQLDEIRGYDAGSSGRSNSNWQVTNQSAEITDRYSRDAIRGKTRDLERNSDMFNGVISAYKRNVVGVGISLQAWTDDETLNTQLEELWEEWTKKRNCDVTGTQSFNQILRMAITRKKVDGGILFVKRYTSGGMIPFKLQMIEVDELDALQTSPKNMGNKVVSGIEYNIYNKPVGYWIRQYSIEGYQEMQPVYLEAKDVVFYFSKKRPSQIREISDMAPTVNRVRDTNEFMTSVSVKERIAACLGILIKRINPVATMGRNVAKADKRNSYEGKSISPGMILEMNAGDEAQILDPKSQATDATNYVKLQQQLMSSGQGLSYEAVARDMSQTNYSSARQGSIEDELTYAEEKELLEDCMSEIYETFVISCYLAGVIEIKGFWEKKALYLKHKWVESPKKWIDPLKEANANRIALQTGQKTYQQVCAENGRDWKEQIDDMSAVLKYAKEKGIELGGVIYGKGKEELYDTTSTTKK